MVEGTKNPPLGGFAKVAAHAREVHAAGKGQAERAAMGVFGGLAMHAGRVHVAGWRWAVAPSEPTAFLESQAAGPDGMTADGVAVYSTDGPREMAWNRWKTVVIAAIEATIKAGEMPAWEAGRIAKALEFAEGKSETGAMQLVVLVEDAASAWVMPSAWARHKAGGEGKSAKGKWKPSARLKGKKGSTIQEKTWGVWAAHDYNYAATARAMGKNPTTIRESIKSLQAKDPKLFKDLVREYGPAIGNGKHGNPGRWDPELEARGAAGRRRSE